MSDLTCENCEKEAGRDFFTDPEGIILCKECAQGLNRDSEFESEEKE